MESRAAIEATTDQLPIGIRPWNRAKEEAFIFETWLKGSKRGTYEAKRIPDTVYFPSRHRMIEGILDRGAQVLIAHPEDDPSTILGCLVWESLAERPVLHWVFVKLAWRRNGIASRLILSAVPDPNRALFTTWTVWKLAVPAPRSVPRTDRGAVRDARAAAIRTAEREGDSGGDTDDLLRKWPGLSYHPDLKFNP